MSRKPPASSYFQLAQASLHLQIWTYSNGAYTKYADLTNANYPPHDGTTVYATLSLPLQFKFYSNSQNQHRGFDLTLGLSGTITGTTNPVCGNGQRHPQEECDDNNSNNGDGCDSTCKLESGMILIRCGLLKWVYKAGETFNGSVPDSAIQTPVDVRHGRCRVKANKMCARVRAILRRSDERWRAARRVRLWPIGPDLA